MALKLHFSPGACSFVPHALLEMTGAAFEPQIVKLAAGEQKTPEYLAINPRAQVPVLVIDGYPLTQVIAIVTYLNDAFPAANILPKDAMAKAKVMSTLAWMNNTFHPTFTHVFRSEKFAQGEASIADVKAFNTVTYRTLLQELDGMVAAKTTEWLGGEHPGPLDLYAMVLTRWGSFGAGQDPTLLPALWAHAQKIAAVPAVARTIERERIKINMFKPAEVNPS
jgi:glutathione S-transferase